MFGAWALRQYQQQKLGKQTCNVKKIVPNFKQPYLLDRHLLHGIDQWKDPNFGSYVIKHKHSVNNLSNGRIVVYFRPVFSDPYDWIYQ